MDQPGYADFRARREATIWQRLNRILFVLLFLAVWLGIISLFVPPYKKMQGLDLMKEGETIFRLEPAKATKSAPKR